MAGMQFQRKFLHLQKDYDIVIIPHFHLIFVCAYFQF